MTKMSRQNGFMQQLHHILFIELTHNTATQ